jgi:hypothetical protein
VSRDDGSRKSQDPQLATCLNGEGILWKLSRKVWTSNLKLQSRTAFSMDNRPLLTPRSTICPSSCPPFHGRRESAIVSSTGGFYLWIASRLGKISVPPSPRQGCLLRRRSTTRSFSCNLCPNLRQPHQFEATMDLARLMPTSQLRPALSTKKSSTISRMILRRGSSIFRVGVLDLATNPQLPSF